jgi:hypothetical protein
MQAGKVVDGLGEPPAMAGLDTCDGGGVVFRRG